MANQLEITVDIIFHATEDIKKILDPISEMFHLNNDEFSREEILGHYGNPIVIVKAKITKNRAEDFVRILVSKVSKSQLENLIENIDMYFEDSSLYLRISKNDLVMKEISFVQNNAVKIKIKIPIYKKDQITQKYTELLKI